MLLFETTKADRLKLHNYYSLPTIDLGDVPWSTPRVLHYGQQTHGIVAENSGRMPRYQSSRLRDETSSCHCQHASVYARGNPGIAERAGAWAVTGLGLPHHFGQYLPLGTQAWPRVAEESGWASQLHEMGQSTVDRQWWLSDGVTVEAGGDHRRGCSVPVSTWWIHDAAYSWTLHGDPEYHWGRHYDAAWWCCVEHSDGTESRGSHASHNSLAGSLHCSTQASTWSESIPHCSRRLGWESSSSVCQRASQARCTRLCHWWAEWWGGKGPLLAHGYHLHRRATKGQASLFDGCWFCCGSGCVCGTGMWHVWLRLPNQDCPVWLCFGIHWTAQLKK